MGKVRKKLAVDSLWLSRILTLLLPTNIFCFSDMPCQFPSTCQDCMFLFVSYLTNNGMHEGVELEGSLFTVGARVAYNIDRNQEADRRL